MSEKTELYERTRLEVLKSFEIVGTPPESCFDELTRLAATLCDTPMALITFVTEDRVWFKSKIGIDISEVPVENSFCREAIEGNQPVVVTDMLSDVRYKNSDLVRNAPFVRFYAAVPLLTDEGAVHSGHFA